MITGGWKKPYFEKGELKSQGSVFEDMFYDMDHTNLSGNHEAEGAYHVGDSVPVQGESFEYPDYFDILSMAGNLAVLVRNKIIQDIISLEDYQYGGFQLLMRGASRS